MGLFSDFTDDVLGFDPGGGGIHDVVDDLAPAAGLAALAFGIPGIMGGAGAGGVTGGISGGAAAAGGGGALSSIGGALGGASGIGSILRGIGGVAGLAGAGGIDFSDVSGRNASNELIRIAQEQAAGMQPFIDLQMPIAEAGLSQLEPLTRGTTASGMDADIASIIGGDAFGALRDERQRAATQQMASAGLRRSGAAAQQAADIPANLALQLEQELNRRRQQQMGQGQTSAALAGGIQGQIGQMLAGAGQQGLQARAAGQGNILDTITQPDVLDSIGAGIGGVVDVIGGIFGGSR